jgi:serine/threonine protein kinase
MRLGWQRCSKSPAALLLFDRMFQEHLDNGELYDHILRQGRLSEVEAGRLFGQVVSAIQHCHQRGVVHRDLKPENILLKKREGGGSEGGDYDLKLVDFGLANYYDVTQDSSLKSLRTQCGQ